MAHWNCCIALSASTRFASTTAGFLARPTLSTCFKAKTLNSTASPRSSLSRACSMSGCIDDVALANQLFTAESDALNVLAKAPCVSEAGFVEKLRYLLAHEARIAEGPQEFGSILVAVD
jgi:hypothetical protein